MNSPGFEEIHLAAQYLAAASISFLQKQADDSHSNLGYSTDQNQVYTKPLNTSGDYLALDLSNFSLKWVTASESIGFLLDGKSHAQVLEWLRPVSEVHVIGKAYQYNFHYSLPYPISETHVFKINEEALKLEMELRSLANTVLSIILAEYAMESEIRIWPHHFDTGAIAKLPGSANVTLGMGLAIPDKLSDHYYFYISGHKDRKALSPASFAPLTNGQWLNNGFKGGILSADNTNEETATRFFNQAIEMYKQK